MKPLPFIERTLAVVGAIAILAIITGQAPSRTDYPTFIKNGTEYVTDTNDKFTPIEAGGGNWYKVNMVVGGYQNQEPVWLNLTRYTWVKPRS